MYCTDLAFFLNSKYSAFEFHPALFIHSINLALFDNSHCCTFEFYSAIFMHYTVHLLITNSHQNLFKLDPSLFMYSSDLEPILNHHFANWGSILPFLCIAQAFLSLSTVIIAYLSSSGFIQFTNIALFDNSHCCTFEFYSAIFMHYTVHLLITNSHQNLFKLDPSLFMYSSDLDPILNHHFANWGSILPFLCIA